MEKQQKLKAPDHHDIVCTMCGRVGMVTEEVEMDGDGVEYPYLVCRCGAEGHYLKRVRED